MITKTIEMKQIMKWNCCGSMCKTKCVVCTIKFFGFVIKTTVKEC